jgi:uncharacterized repeat protein (TIGR02543 family)
MSQALVWDELGEKLYETGVDHGVLYPFNSTTNQYDEGFAWNGLTAVNETPSGAEANDLYADNIKYLSLYSAEKLEATIEAYQSPKEFDECDGSASLTTGVKLYQQNRKSFGFVFRSKVGNDTEGDEYGYKLHLLYGCKASPSERGYSTVNESPEAITFSWSISTTPVNVSGFKPTSLITVDSRDFNTEELRAKLAALEAVLFGSSAADARLPLPDEVKSILEGAQTVTLTFDANGHGTAPAAQTVIKGGVATIPEAPTAEGWDFGGWFNEAGCTTQFIYSEPLNADKTVYAKWTEAEG